MRGPRIALLLLGLVAPFYAQTAQNVLLVVNRKDALSQKVGAYYAQKRAIPPANVCNLSTVSDEEIDWKTYQTQIERPVANCLTKGGLQEKVLYIVLTAGMPFKVSGTDGALDVAEQASVDSELTLLYSKLKGAKVERRGGINNPFFRKMDVIFSHPQYPIYLVTRLAAYDWNDIQAMIDRSLAARNAGKFVLDLRGPENEMGNDWLRDAALLISKDRVMLEETKAVVYDQKDVVGFASWGSNDKSRKRRWLGFQWVPGGIAMEYVSTNMRTLKRPPDQWTYSTWQDHEHLWADSPQGLAADLIHEGATGAAGNAYEPYLNACARPDLVLPAYFAGRNLAESFYLGVPYLSWQTIILGDPLCALGRPGR